ncbi:hypothetical protein ER57_17085 [Smithella sp. SCADC]|jgi:hypothetical protein|nr:hypothetical protein ER57_17085 [Smithella sp. SCADC]HAR48817.1 hypothetical protein [Smithella sp.]
MKKIIVVFTIFAMASSASAGDVGKHNISNDRGFVRVRSIKGNVMKVDVFYTPDKERIIILTGVFADYDSQTREAIYSEDRSCPDSLKIKFLNNGKIINVALPISIFLDS